MFTRIVKLLMLLDNYKNNPKERRLVPANISLSSHLIQSVNQDVT